MTSSLNGAAYSFFNGIGPQKPLISKRLDTVGDGSGSDDMAVDGSITPVSFFCRPAPGYVTRCARMMVFVEDNGSFDADSWGNSVVMANGLVLSVRQNGVVYNINNWPIKTAGDLAAGSFDVDVKTWGAGNEFMIGRMTFTKMGQFIRLDGDTGDYISMTVNDNLSTLVRQHITIQGHYEKFPGLSVL